MKVEELEDKNTELTSNVHALQQLRLRNDVVVYGVNLTANETHKELAEKVVFLYTYQKIYI